MMTQESKKKRFEELRKGLLGELQVLNRCMKEYNSLIKIWEKEPEIINFDHAFFTVITKAMWSLLINNVYKLLIDKKSTLSLINYMKFVEDNQEHFKQGEASEIGVTRMLSEDQQKLEQRKPILASVMKRRNNYYAHFNEEFTRDTDKLSTKFPFSWQDFEEVISTAGEIINRYSTAYDGQSFGLIPIVIRGGECSIYELIRRENERIEKERQERSARLKQYYEKLKQKNRIEEKGEDRP